MGITSYALEHATRLGIIPERLEVLDRQLQSYVDSGQRQAIVLKATKQGVSIFEGTYGTNTKPGGVNMDTIFNVASITKPVIATLIMCMQEDGLIDITEPVCRYLPEFKGEGKEEICIWHFMTHSSGMNDSLFGKCQDYIKENLGVDLKDDSITQQEFEKREKEALQKLGVSEDTTGRMADLYYLISLKMKPDFKPGVDMSYFSYGYQRLADILVQVSGKSLDVYASEKIFQPLGMKDTYWKLPKEKYDKVIGRNDSAVSASWFNSEENYQIESGSGGLKTNVQDMTIFMQMILGRGTYQGVRILSPASVKLMFANHNKGVLSNGNEEYASWSLGWNIKCMKKDGDGILRSENAIDHTGYAGTKILIDPERELTLASFSVENVFYMEPEFLNMNGRVVNMLIAALDR